MPLMKIRLELARTKDFPDGSVERGYEFTAPLTPDGHLDLDGWHTHRDACTVRRFWAEEGEEKGRLIHRGGAWLFHYQPPPDAVATEEPPPSDEPVFKFDRHRFVTGDYLSVTEHDGVQRPFKVVRVEKA